MSTPSEDLAKKIAARLKKETLVRSADEKTLEEDLADGKVKAADWRLLLEKAMDKE